jgi:hypothetical protein
MTMLAVRGSRLAAVIWLAMLASPGLAQDLAEADAFDRQLIELSQKREYAEATEIAKRVLSIREKVLGPQHPDPLCQHSRAWL